MQIQEKQDHASTGNMRLVPAGKFTMGAEGWGEFESPVHEVFIDDFLMDQAPVTNQEFAAFVTQTNYCTTAEIAGFAKGYRNGEMMQIDGLHWKTYFTEERKNHPVVLVSWHDANAYAHWAEKKLPTEAEWEKAARGGLTGNLYPWGDKVPDNTMCNFAKETTNFPCTTAVKTFSANAFGLYDMAGNVWNWCSDWFGEKYYSERQNENPAGASAGTNKVRRGGSFNIIQAFRLRCANRGAYDADNFAINIGFRCVKALKHD